MRRERLILKKVYLDLLEKVYNILLFQGCSGKSAVVKNQPGERNSFVEAKADLPRLTCQSLLLNPSMDGYNIMPLLLAVLKAQSSIV